MINMTVKVSNALKKLAKTSRVKLSKRNHARLSAAWRRAIREFIRVVLLNTLKDTGMSRGSLIPLSRMVRSLTKTRTSASGGGRKPNQQFRGRWADQPSIKSRAAGEQLGEKAYIINTGSPAQPRFKFSFTIPVFQWFLHENGMAKSGPGAQNSLGKGAAAFDASVVSDYKRLGVDLRRFFRFGVLPPQDNN